jgi:ABC-type nitrate/sulfonate/bicarbonate transport system permease component
LATWQVWVSVNHYNPIVMPSPAGVAMEVISHPLLYLRNGSTTLAVALFGTAIGLLIGTSIATACWASRVVEGLLTPLALMFSSVPVVALIPIIARVLGYDETTVLAAVAVITFFPSFVFVSAGLRDIPPGSGDLFKVYGASRGATLLRLALPAAMPNLAIALRFAAGNGVLAAMVAEFLMGNSGLGHLFELTKSELNMESAIAASVVATALSISLFFTASRIEHRIRDRLT